MSLSMIAGCVFFLAVLIAAISLSTSSPDDLRRITEWIDAFKYLIFNVVQLLAVLIFCALYLFHYFKDR